MKYINLINDEAYDALEEAYSQISVPSIRMKYYDDGTHRTITRTHTQEHRSDLLLASFILGCCGLSLYDYLQYRENGDVTKGKDFFVSLISGETAESAYNELGSQAKTAYNTANLNSSVRMIFNSIGNLNEIQSMIADAYVEAKNSGITADDIFDLNNDGTVTMDELILLSRLTIFSPDNVSFSGIKSVFDWENTSGATIYDAVSYAVGTSEEEEMEDLLDVNRNGSFDMEDFIMFVSNYMFGSYAIKTDSSNPSVTITSTSVFSNSSNDTLYYTTANTASICLNKYRSTLSKTTSAKTTTTRTSTYWGSSAMTSFDKMRWKLIYQSLCGTTSTSKSKKIAVLQEDTSAVTYSFVDQQVECVIKPEVEWLDCAWDDGVSDSAVCGNQVVVTFSVSGGAPQTIVVSGGTQPGAPTSTAPLPLPMLSGTTSASTRVYVSGSTLYSNGEVICASASTVVTTYPAYYTTKELMGAEIQVDCVAGFMVSAVTPYSAEKLEKKGATHCIFTDTATGRKMDVYFVHVLYRSSCNIDFYVESNSQTPQSSDYISDVILGKIKSINEGTRITTGCTIDADFNITEDEEGCLDETYSLGYKMVGIDKNVVDCLANDGIYVKLLSTGFIKLFNLADYRISGKNYLAYRSNILEDSQKSYNLISNINRQIRTWMAFRNSDGTFGVSGTTDSVKAEMRKKYPAFDIVYDGEVTDKTSDTWTIVNNTSNEISVNYVNTEESVSEVTIAAGSSETVITALDPHFVVGTGNYDSLSRNDKARILSVIGATSSTSTSTVTTTPVDTGILDPEYGG